jgi:D-sedoheptulose 7-phosphate isomerase
MTEPLPLSEATVAAFIKDSAAFKQTMLEDRALIAAIVQVAEVCVAAYRAGNKILIAGNGGSAADAQHLAGELVGRYKRNRRPLPAVALSVDPSVLTCIANDYAYEDVFGRQVEALVGPRDVVIAFSTSGESANVVRGLTAARQVRATTVLFTGGEGGAARQQADLALVVPSTTTARIQEMHVLLLHLLSERIDVWATGGEAAEQRDPGVVVAPER